MASLLLGRFFYSHLEIAKDQTASLAAIVASTVQYRACSLLGGHFKLDTMQALVYSSHVPGIEGNPHDRTPRCVYAIIHDCKVPAARSKHIQQTALYVLFSPRRGCLNESRRGNTSTEGNMAGKIQDPDRWQQGRRTSKWARQQRRGAAKAGRKELW